MFLDLYRKNKINGNFFSFMIIAELADTCSA